MGEIFERVPLSEIVGEDNTSLIADGDWIESKDQDPNGNVRLIQLADIGDGIFKNVSRRYLTKEKAAELNCTYLKKGDLLVARMPDPIGRCAIFPDINQSAVTAVDVCIVRPGKNVVRQWLMQAINMPQIRYRMNALAGGGTRQRISTSELKALKLPRPSLAEQRKIAAILRTWDEALEKLNALRAAKAKRHVGLTHSLVFGGMQLEEFRGSNEATSYRWFQLPAVWGCKPIGDLAVEISERNTDGDALDVLSCSKHDGFVRSLEYFKKQVFSADLTGYKKISRGDFGFPSNHVEEGSIGLQNLTEIGVVSPIYTVFRFDPSKVLGEYAFAVLKTEIYRHIFEVSTSASVDRRGSLRWKEFARLPFPVPPLAEQEAIAEVLHTSKSEIDALDAEIEATSRQKRGLMQKLLTGEWRVEVSGDEEAAA